MGVKLAYINSNPLPRSSRSKAKLTLIQGDKDIPILWPSDLQMVPLPKAIPAKFTCHKCGESDEFVWINDTSIYCYQCNLTSLQVK